MESIIKGMDRHKLALLTLAGTFAAGFARAQGDDWMQYIGDQLSTDTTVTEAAAKSMRGAIDAAMHEDVATLRKHLASIAPAFQDKDERVRNAVSGIFYVLFQSPGEQRGSHSALHPDAALSD